MTKEEINILRKKNNEVQKTLTSLILDCDELDLALTKLSELCPTTLISSQENHPTITVPNKRI